MCTGNVENSGETREVVVPSASPARIGSQHPRGCDAPLEVSGEPIVNGAKTPIREGATGPTGPTSTRWYLYTAEEKDSLVAIGNGLKRERQRAQSGTQRFGDRLFDAWVAANPSRDHSALTPKKIADSYGRFTRQMRDKGFERFADIDTRHQTSHPKNATKEREADVTRGAATEAVPEENTEPEEIYQRVTPKLPEVTEGQRQQYLVLTEEAGDPSKRKPVGKKGLAVDSDRLLIADQLFQSYWEGSPRTVEDLSRGTYAAALFALNQNNNKTPKPNGEPAYLVKLREKVGKCRKYISWADQETKRQLASRPATRKQEFIRRQLRTMSKSLHKDKLKSFSEHEKSKLAVASAELGAAEQKRRRRELNRNFNAHGISVLDTKDQAVAKTPDMSAVEGFWSGIVGVEGDIDLNDIDVADWLKDAGKLPQEYAGPIIGDIVWSKLTKKLRPWRAPGPDGIRNFWWKKLPSANIALRETVESLLNGRAELPQWLCSGRTVLLFKKGDTEDPANYRPIACLNTIYKAMTAIIADTLLTAALQQKVLPIEQRALRTRKRGTWDCLAMDQAVTNEFRWRGQTMAMAWFDFKKAYDRVNHVMVKRTVSAIELPSWVEERLAAMLCLWRTRYELRGPKGKKEQSKYVQYQRGLFQGDSLAPVLFVLAITPLSHALRQRDGITTGAGFKITHQLYMDDLKVYSKTINENQGTIETVQRVSTAIGMELGLPKCATVCLAQSKCKAIPPEKAGGIPVLGEADEYTYLGVPQNIGICLESLQKSGKKVFLDSVEKIMRSELNVGNKISAYNSVAVAKLRYVMPTLAWNVNQLEELEVQVRHIMGNYMSWHYSVAVERFHLPNIPDGGYGFEPLVPMRRSAVESLAKYILTTTDDPYITGLTKTLVWQAENWHRDSLLRVINKWRPTIPTQEDALTMLHPKEHRRRFIEDCRQSLAARPVHGRFRDWAKSDHTYRWLKEGRVDSVVAANILSAQDCSIRTNAWKFTFAAAKSDKCRICGKFRETVGHILAGCTLHSFSLYSDKHNEVQRVLQWSLAVSLGIVTSKKGEFQTLPIVVENEKGKIVYDKMMFTIADMKGRKPDLQVWWKDRKILFLVEVAVANDRNVLGRATQKGDHYAKLKQDLFKQYPAYKVEIVPIVVGNLGSTDSLDKEVGKLHFLSKPEQTKLVTDMQRSAVISSSRIIRNHLGKPQRPP